MPGSESALRCEPTLAIKTYIRSIKRRLYIEKSVFAS
jgi:hypothetical protein